MGERIFFSPALEDEFRVNGFVVIRLLSEDEAADLLRRFERLEPEDGFQPDGTGPNQSGYHCTFLDANHDYRRQVNDLVRSTFQPRIDEVVARYRMLTANLYVKPPGEGRFEIHQNWPTVRSLTDTTVTVWCPLVATDESNGTLQLVPRSHKILPDIAAISAEKYFIDFYDELIERWLQPVCLAPGESVIFDDSLLHWSESNHGPCPRWAVQIECIPAEAEAVAYYFDADHHPPRFEVYSVDDEFFIEHGVEQFARRPTVLEQIGVVEHVNRRLTSEEFAELMQHGDEIRASVYAGKAPWESTLSNEG